MKKGSTALLLVVTLFLGILLGMVITRRKATSFVLSSAGQAVIQADAVSQNSDTALTGQSRKIDINTASLSLLQTLPNIGNVIAQRIIDYRTQYGSFTSLEDLLLVEGICEKRLDEIRPYITVGG